jgi:predicted nucleic acid-binding protein
MAAGLNRKWALDTNVVIDLAANIDAAWTLVEIAKERGYTLHVTRRVLAELADLALRGSSIEIRKYSRHALEKLDDWNISELSGTPTDGAVAIQFSVAARGSGLIPQPEVNDGIILAEASLGGAALLVSGDKHVNGMDQDELRLLFESRDMRPISTTSPAKLCSLFSKSN